LRTDGEIGEFQFQIANFKFQIEVGLPSAGAEGEMRNLKKKDREMGETSNDESGIEILG
jgi:hypothetical protein